MPPLDPLTLMKAGGFELAAIGLVSIVAMAFAVERLLASAAAAGHSRAACFRAVAGGRAARRGRAAPNLQPLPAVPFDAEHGGRRGLAEDRPAQQ